VGEATKTERAGVQETEAGGFPDGHLVEGDPAVCTREEMEPQSEIGEFLTIQSEALAFVEPALNS
jgi:hypothetical protein